MAPPGRPLLVGFVPKDGLFFTHCTHGKCKIHGSEVLLVFMILKALKRDFRLISIDQLQSRYNSSDLRVLNFVQNGRADIGVSSQVLLADDMEIVDFTVPYFYSDISFVTNLPIPKPRVYAFLYSFDITSWALIAILLLVMPFVSAALFEAHDFSKNWLNMLGNFLLRSVTQPIQGPSQLIFVIPWWFGTIILSFSYISLILSCLTVPIMDVPPNDFKQLSEAVQSGEYKVRAFGDNMVEPILATSNSPDVRYLHDAMEKNDWYFYGENFADYIHEPKSALVQSSLHSKLSFGVPPYATKYQSSDGVFPFCMGMIVNKRRTRLKKRLDVIISRIVQAGLPDKLVEDRFFRMWLKSPTFREPGSTINPISLNDFSGAFLILAIGLFISIVVFIIECIIYKCGKPG